MHFDRQPFSRAAFPEQQLLFDAFSGATIYWVRVKMLHLCLGKVLGRKNGQISSC
jgi:hypothetical protein